MSRWIGLGLILSLALVSVGCPARNPGDNDGGCDAGDDAGCDDGGDPGFDGGDDGGLDGGDDAGLDGGEVLVCVDGGSPAANPLCNSLAFGTSLLIAEQEIDQNGPQGAGGAAVDGTYYLTTWSLYTGNAGNPGPTGNSQRQVWELSSGTLNEAIFDPVSCVIERTTGTVALNTVQGTSTYTPTCGCTGLGCGGTADYSADATSFTLITGVGGNDKSVNVMTKQ